MVGVDRTYPRGRRGRRNGGRLGEPEALDGALAGGAAAPLVGGGAVVVMARRAAVGRLAAQGGHDGAVRPAVSAGLRIESQGVAMENGRGLGQDPGAEDQNHGARRGHAAPF